MLKPLNLFLDRWLLWALFSSALMLAIAHAFETFGGYAPCTLCLRQREVYWLAGSVAIVGLVVEQLSPLKRWVWLFQATLALTFALGMAVAVYHSGAEWKFWPGPTTCASTGASVTLDSLTAIANGTAKIKPPACDEAAWRFLGLSMAGWNALISLELAVLSALAALGFRIKR